MGPVLYLSGPMRGYPELNRPAFERTRACWNSYFRVVSPFDIMPSTENEDTPVRNFILRDIAVLSSCAGIVMLPGWEASRGAVAEFFCARWLGLPAYDAETREQIDFPFNTPPLPGTPPPAAQEDAMRRFDTGATRDTDAGKLDYTGFLSPAVLRRYAAYMHQHRTQPDGTLRAPDNWKKGIPLDAYRASLGRHFMDAWLQDEGWETDTTDEDTLCAIMFNAMGWLHELLKRRAQQGGSND